MLHEFEREARDYWEAYSSRHILRFPYALALNSREGAVGLALSGRLHDAVSFRDFDGIAKALAYAVFACVSEWNTLTPARKEEFLAVFERAELARTEAGDSHIGRIEAALDAAHETWVLLCDQILENREHAAEVETNMAVDRERDLESGPVDPCLVKEN